MERGVIFQPDAIKAIKKGDKTMTRRPVTRDRKWGFEKPCRYVVGHAYSMQPGRSEKGVGHFTVTAVRREPLGSITPKDIAREGFKFPTEFWKRWTELHGTPDKTADVWVISFTFGDLSEQMDRPRLLAATPGHVTYGAAYPGERDGKKAHQIITGSTGDYTPIASEGMSGEQEAPGATTMGALSQAARVHHAVNHVAQVLAPVHVSRQVLEGEMMRIKALLAENPNSSGELLACLRDLERQMRRFGRALDAA